MANEFPKKKPDEMDDKPQTERKHPREYERDLNPDRMQGQNLGVDREDALQGHLMAADRKDQCPALSRYDDALLEQLPVVRAGERLRQGATYLDLCAPHPREFTARADQEATADRCYVPKDEVPYETWNRVVG